MFDHNVFKKSVKEWIRENPAGTLNDLIDFCEEKIPSNQFSANRWIIDQTVSWYKHILAHRELTQSDFASDDGI